MSEPLAGATNPPSAPQSVFDQGGGVIGSPSDLGVPDGSAAEADAAPTEDAQPDDGDDAVQQQGEDAQTDERPPNREARYRTERNAARERVSQLEAQLTNLQEDAVARMASTYLVNGGDAVLWGGVADCLDENGVPDPAKVRAVCKQLGKDRPYMLKPHVSFAQGARGVPPAGAASWQDVIQKGLQGS